MALDFPTPPFTNGQTFGNWVYNSTKGVWQSKPLTPTKTVNSPTAPTSPADGDQWFNTNTGQLFIYYVDVNGGQWVESRAPITADGYISPNYIINGGMDIWQRGTSGTVGATVGFAADRWQSVTYAGGTMYWFQVAAGTNPAGARYALRIQRASGATNTATMNIAYSLETADVVKLAGKTVTWSFYARKGATYSPASNLLNIRASWGTNTDTSIFTGGISGGANPVDTVVTLTNDWVRYTQTFTIPSNATSFGITWYSAVTGTAGASDFYDIVGVQLEEGSVATPFRRNSSSFQGELVACQRYYVVAGSNGSTFAMPAFASTDSNLASTMTYFPTVMRATPTTITTYDFSGTAGNAHRQFQGSGGGTNTAVAVNTKNQNGFSVNTNIGSQDKAGMYYLWYKADAEL